MKTLKLLLIGIIGIVLALNAFLLPFQALAFSTSYYVENFTELEVHKSIGISLDSLSRVTDALVQFIDNGSGDLLLTEDVHGENVIFYNEKERIHLDDIRLLVIAARKFILIMNAIMVIAIAIILRIEKNDKANIGKSIAAMFKASFITTVLGLVFLIALYFIDFNWAFTKFHEIFFTNELWLLNPNTDRLIQLMPIEFFIRFVATWLSRVAIIMGIYVLLGFILPQVAKMRKRKLVQS